MRATLHPRTILALACLAAAAARAPAQSRWTVDSKTSIAWWQVSPHLNHLWATTCPQEPSWRPGEGRSSGCAINRALKLPKTGYANTPDTVHVPLYPRGTVVQPICAEAVRGQAFVPDTTSWRGARAQVIVNADALVTGEDMRDLFARKAVLQTQSFPEIRFTLDSLVALRRQAGDTLRGTVAGTLSLHGVGKPISALVTAWRQDGGLRVLAKFHLPAATLLTEFGFSRWALGLGIGTGIWKDLFMGVDLVFRPEAQASGS